MARKRQQSITTDGRYAQKQYLRNLSGVVTPANSDYAKVNADNAGALRAQNAGEYHAMRAKLKQVLAANRVGVLLWAGAMALGSELLKNLKRNQPLDPQALIAKYTVMGLDPATAALVLATITGTGNTGAGQQSAIPIQK